jgi:probable rRNA maturation factor
MRSLVVEVIDEQNLLCCFSEYVKCRKRIVAELKEICCRILSDVDICFGHLNVAIVGGVAMREYNIRFLGHDYVTDVISFRIDYKETCEGDKVCRYLEGDIVVCAEVAIERSSEFGWSALEEFFLYVIHGTLHLAGYDDKKNAAKKIMQKKESEYINKIKKKIQKI